MNELIIQRTRAMLQSRVRRVRMATPVHFPAACKQFMRWIEGDPVISGAARKLLGPAGQAWGELASALSSYEGGITLMPIRYSSTYEEQAAVGHATLRLIADRKPPTPGDEHGQFACCSHPIAVVAQKLGGRHCSNITEAVGFLCDHALDPLFEYLDEQLDARNVTLAILRQYKDRCELLRRQRLRDAAEQGLEGHRGERAIVIDLCEYLHDQGVRFIVEPVHADGRPDAVLARSAGDEAIIDAKLVNDPNKAKRTILGGFRQVAAYCRARSEPIGYLLVYATTPLDVHFSDGANDDGFPCVRMGDCTVYYVLVNIADGPSASKLPKAREIDISREDLNTAEEEAGVGDSTGANG